MRRTVGFGVMAATVVVLAGVAGAETAHAPQPPGSAPVAALGRAVNGAVDAVSALPGVDRTGPARAGTVERMTRLLVGGSTERSTTLRYPGAEYVKVHLSRAVLRPGDTVTVADPGNAEVYRYDAEALSDLDGRWAMSITGDTAVVTVDGGAVRVDRVARGLTVSEREAEEAAERARRDGREESVCGGDDKSDAVCYRSSDPTVYKQSKAVVRLLINGNELCTGWRLGPTNRVVTNNHCVADSRAAYNTEVWFNYQCAACGGFAVFRPTKVWGNQVLLTDRMLDLTVFTVNNFEQVEKFGHLELELARPSAGDEVVIPQHPAGEPTRIAARSDEDRSGTCAVVDPNHNGYAAGTDVSYYCDTEGGSSGSPVLSRRTGKVIALHHFGGCPNSGVRADLINRRLASLG